MSLRDRVEVTTQALEGGEPTHASDGDGESTGRYVSDTNYRGVLIQSLAEDADLSDFIARFGGPGPLGHLLYNKLKGGRK